MKIFLLTSKQFIYIKKKRKIKKIKIFVSILGCLFFQTTYSQEASKLTREEAHKLSLLIVPKAIFLENENEVPEQVLAGKKKVSEIGWSAPCPAGQSGGIIGITTCYVHSFLGITWGEEWCVDTFTYNGCY